MYEEYKQRGAAAREALEAGAPVPWLLDPFYPLTEGCIITDQGEYEYEVSVSTFDRLSHIGHVADVGRMEACVAETGKRDTALSSYGSI